MDTVIIRVTSPCCGDVTLDNSEIKILVEEYTIGTTTFCITDTIIFRCEGCYKKLWKIVDSRTVDNLIAKGCKKTLKSADNREMDSYLKALLSDLENCDYLVKKLIEETRESGT